MNWRPGVALMGAGPSRARLWLVLGIVALAYGPWLGGPFLWDDMVYLGGHDFTWRFHPLDAFLPSRYFAAGYPESSAYHPLSTASHMAAHALWGVSPFRDRLVNLALHLLNVWLLRRFLLLHRAPAAAADGAALLYGVHPALSETIFCAYFRHDPLVVACGLLAVLAHAADRTGGVLACIGLALLTKEPAVALPALLPLYDVWARSLAGGDGAVRWRRAGAAAALVAGYGLLRLQLLGAQLDWHKIHPDPLVTLWAGALSALAALPVALGAAVAPAHLIVYYDLPPAWSLGEPRVIAGLAVVALYLAALRAAAARNRLCAFGLGWAGLAYLPTTHVIPAAGYHSFFSERYLSLPLTGAAIAGAALLRGWEGWAPPGRRALTALAAALVVAGVARIGLRGWEWQDPGRLYRSTLEKFPRSSGMRHALAEAYEKAGAHEEAVMSYRRFLTMRPGANRAWMRLGICLKRLGRYAEAEAAYRRALRLTPGDGHTQFSLGVLMSVQGRHLEAARWYREALGRSPQVAEWWRALAAAYTRAGRLDLAAPAFAEYEKHPAMIRARREGR